MLYGRCASSVWLEERSYERGTYYLFIFDLKRFHWFISTSPRETKLPTTTGKQIESRNGKHAPARSHLSSELIGIVPQEFEKGFFAQGS